MGKINDYDPVLVAAEYTSLRDEILALHKQRLTFATAPIFGLSALAGFAFQNPKATPFLLCVPLLSFVMVQGWRWSMDRTIQIVNYIQEMERKCPSLGWATFLSKCTGGSSKGKLKSKIRLEPMLRLPLLSFAGASLTAFAIYVPLALSTGSSVEASYGLLALAILATVLTPRSLLRKQMYSYVNSTETEKALPSVNETINPPIIPDLAVVSSTKEPGVKRKRTSTAHKGT